MDSLIQTAKNQTLLAMYRSLDRMNQAVADSNSEVYQAEQGLQQNLRNNFEDLLATG